MMKRRRFPTVCVLLVASLHSQRAEADVVIKFAETAGNVQVSYQGELDLSGLVLEDTTPGVARHQIGRNVNVDESLGIFANTFAPAAGRRSVVDAFSEIPATPWTLQAPVAADEFGGDHFFLHNIALAPLQLDPGDFIGSTWSGSGFMQFNNTTLADLGLKLEGRPTYVINNSTADTIQFTAVPEPSAAGVLALLAAAIGCRRRSRIEQ